MTQLDPEELREFVGSARANGESASILDKSIALSVHQICYEWDACIEPGDVEDLLGDRTHATVREILESLLLIPEYVFWLLTRPGVLPERVLWELACLHAEYALDQLEATDVDQHSLDAIETRRKWLRGEAGDSELREAQNTALDAVFDAAFIAAGAVWTYRAQETTTALAATTAALWTTWNGVGPLAARIETAQDVVYEVICLSSRARQPRKAWADILENTRTYFEEEDGG